MIDLAELAGRARAALACADQATLLIDGIGRVPAGDSTVTLQDDAGQPVFWCRPGSAIVASAVAHRPAVLTIPAANRTGTTLTVALVGRLEHLRADRLGGVAVDLVALPPAQVLVEHDQRGCPTVAQLRVPLALYAESTPDPLMVCAARILEHGNRAHQHELRHYIAARTDTGIAAIAGAQLVALDRAGALVHWIDTDGAHSTTITFAHPADTPEELAERLREQLLAG